MSAYHVLALDPGKTTGICYGHLEDGVLKLEVTQAVLSLADTHELMTSQLGRYRPISVIYEDFTYRNASRMGLDLTPVKIIAIVELFREWYEDSLNGLEFYKQSAATGKAFYTDEKLKGLGIYKKGTPHGRDAERHLMQWANFGGGAQHMDLEQIKVELV